MPSLDELAAALRAEGTVISGHVTEPVEAPVLGPLAARGPRCADAPDSYSLVVESIREGYLLHYAEPRILDGLDADLALLAGDHLYALGLDRLARLGDLDAVRELADLISLCAQLAAAGRAVGHEASSLWLASTMAVATGVSTAHERGKEALRRGEDGAGTALLAEASARADEAGIGAALEEAAEAIESAAGSS
jgi:hypothetical protein